MKKNILIVDDDENLLNGLRRELRAFREQYAFHFTSDSMNAVDLVAELKIDLLVLDILMPEKDGIEIINEMIEKHPDIKIVAMSGGGQIDAKVYLDLAKDVGALYSISKPFSAAELMFIIKDMLEQVEQ